MAGNFEVVWISVGNTCSCEAVEYERGIDVEEEVGQGELNLLLMSGRVKNGGKTT